MSKASFTLGSGSLAAYYRRLIFLGTLIFLLLVGWTVWSGWQRQYAQEINLAHQRVHESAIHLKAIIKASTDHLSQLQYWANHFPEHAPYSGANELGVAMKNAIASSRTGEFTLDALSALPQEQRLGQMLGLTTGSQPRQVGKPTQLDLGLSLLNRMDYARKTSPFLRWSYFFSANKDLVVMSPWAISKEPLGEEPNIQSFLEHSWTYEVTTYGLAANNPQRLSYWTPAYPDQAGAGLMVSHGAPIYWDNEFVGVVATDVLLGFLGDFLQTFPDPDGILVIANEQGQILGDRRQPLKGSTEIQSITTLLPSSGPSWKKLTDSRGEILGSDRIFVAGIDNPQWRVLYLLPQSIITQRVLKAYSAQLALAALLVFAAFVMQWTLWRMYVAPALHIADFVAQESAGGQPAIPSVPRQWRPWIEVMAQAFIDRRQYLAQLQASNEALEQRVADRTQELVAANQRLEKLSVTDPLTGAFNRRQLFDLLDKERQRIWRGGQSMAVLMLDLDHFKRVNDHFGHAAGDTVLREFVRRCQETVRSTDAVCRYGGEEFVLLLPTMSSAGAASLAERLRSIIAATPVEFEDRAIPISVSIGVAGYRDRESIEALLARADQLLYQAKAAGRNQVATDAADSAPVVDSDNPSA
ncbi:MAG: diguanylate cyclase [Rhodoferax sp.]|nr:diguanylate cyclase [Rhodoferax sp.]MCF8208506.1 diguanylate cyclase [Rhodoferax sp.]